MLRVLGLTLLIASVALVAFDAALYFKGGRAFALTTAEQLWNLFAGQRLFDLRTTFASWFGDLGAAAVDLPAIAITFTLGLLLAWIGQRSGERAS